MVWYQLYMICTKEDLETYYNVTNSCPGMVNYLLLYNFLYSLTVHNEHDGFWVLAKSKTKCLKVNVMYTKALQWMSLGE